jgi:hypothetical protein
MEFGLLEAVYERRIQANRQFLEVTDLVDQHPVHPVIPSSIRLQRSDFDCDPNGTERISATRRTDLSRGNDQSAKRDVTGSSCGWVATPQVAQEL